MKNILEFLELSAEKYNKIAYASIDEELTFKELYDTSRALGTFIASYGFRNKPVVLFFDKDISLIKSIFGTLYSGNYYVIVDVKMPIDRINSILENLKPSMFIYDSKYENILDDLKLDLKIAYSDDLFKNIDVAVLDNIRMKMIDTDIMYVLYTSGSTGAPKGTICNHRSVISYLNWYSNTFNIDENTIFGGQTPLYFSASVSDFFSTIIKGSTYYIIPKSYFIFPIKLVEFMNDKKINFIYWVPSALAIFANLKVLEYSIPKYLKNVLFVGEVMPTPKLNYWRKYLPNCFYANLFGPTETIDICTYYVVKREFRNDESLPIGRHCDNVDVFILKSDDTLANKGEEGELVVRGSFLASGYLGMPEKTAKSFCQNPLNTLYPEIIYRTGDIVRENEEGELIYLTRKDFQIKHMGYRIELGEIETAILSNEKVKNVVSIYDSEVDEIILIYEGRLKIEEIYDLAVLKLPKYMVPNKIIKVSQIVLNSNGKIDRVYYIKNYKNL